MSLSRRSILKGAAAGAVLTAAPMVMGANHGKPKVVVVGGGAGGATVARYLAKDSKGEIDVTLIEPTRTYYTCFFSNLYLGGFRTLDSIAHSYGKLASEYGINVVHDWAVGVDRDKKTVALAGGGAVPYDRLVLSPGIDFVDGAVPGWDIAAQNKMPHAYKAGSQTELLKAQVESMREGGVFVMVAPPNPYRCPPGPYERVSMVAHVLKAKNPKAKILIFDPKDKFSKQGLFQEGWEARYPGMVDWLDASFTGPLKEVRPDSMEVVVGGEVTKADVVNVIPAQKAGRIAELAGVTDEKGWAPVVPATMQSRMDENIHVLGDATNQGDMPKSGFSANSQAKVAANAIRGALTGSKVFPAKFSNTCWSLIDTDNGVKVGAAYEATPEKIAKTSGFISQTGEDAALRKQTYEESLGWYSGITADMFG
ncbi:MAG: FAD-dependent oxidoreductase [Nisaea sp.]|uniref:NAD(P)/FAD-dependent oxidoreductase n=1 Tax=Nisaea sp. TaxID=2024842 RepID=UPI001B16D379|nr:NAD(P)/FAD-dependent oxidoreductase [Nisaea sp.]MBO6562796.1 FAD-dependent oxidoreductase [Nisaea sp.]